jgi:AcrR family transcriptional regulator
MSTSCRPRSEATRKKILEAAYGVFVRSGYERATLADMSDAAGVHLQTLVRHFPTKGDLMAEIHVVSMKRFNKYFSERTMDALSTWRSWVELNANLMPEIIVFPSDSYRFPAVTPEGQGAIFEIKEILADGIAEDLGVSRETDLRPTLIACALTAANAHVAQSWAGKRMKRNKCIASLLEVVEVTRESLGREFRERKVA